MSLMNTIPKAKHAQRKQTPPWRYVSHLGVLHVEVVLLGEFEAACGGENLGLRNRLRRFRFHKCRAWIICAKTGMCKHTKRQCNGAKTDSLFVSRIFLRIHTRNSFESSLSWQVKTTKGLVPFVECCSRKVNTSDRLLLFLSLLIC